MVTAAVLIGIGYTNFSSKPKGMDSNTLAVSSTNNLGDVQLVSSSATIVENNNSISSNLISNDNTVASNLVKNNNTNSISNTSSNSAIVENDNNKNIAQNTSSASSVTSTSSSSSNSKNNSSFSELKMERDEMYSKSLETYQKIADSEDISSDQKSIAVQEIQKITELQNSIKVSEELIKLKGFDDVVIYSSNEQISVIVRVAVLSDSQVAQIQNIISKELGTEISNITISNK